MLKLVKLCTCSVILTLLLQKTDSQALLQQEEENSSTRCYDDQGRPQKCHPPFENAAFGRRVEATNTCGEEGPSEYCVQTGQGNRRPCDICDARVPRSSHPPQYLTDLTTNDDETWWQSGTMFEGVDYPLRVNLTLHLKKTYDITYVRLKFHSPRPESFVIYKRMTEDGPWLPFQFYSASCRGFYEVQETDYVPAGAKLSQPLCTSFYSDISPLTGGEVAFSTLAGRIFGEEFDSSPELQDWVTATDIRITLDRHNTFGDELFYDNKVLKSYFYAVTDLAVGGRCKCNGHASECIDSTSVTGERRKVCKCEHNTAGPDCNECKPFYNDRPWARATVSDAYECRPCNCNGFSDRCEFNQTLYEFTGHGGHCRDCRGNRDGPNCEKCKPNYFQRPDGYCIPCHCHELGSRNLQCNIEGKCQCRPGVTGDKCDRCEANYYALSSSGCTPCSCSVPGSLGNEPNCDENGTCRCKDNVEGLKCNNCKPGYFNLDLDNEFGCTPCFCFGHAAVCNSTGGYGQVLLESLFTRNSERWGAEETFGRNVPTQYNAVTQNIGVSSVGREAVYFLAPERFLGDQRGSYNQELNFTLRIGEHGPKPSADDIILEGAGLRISRPIFGQRNPLPSIQNQEFSFRLHEHPDFGWNPRLTARDFMSILSNLTAIKVRGTFTPRGVGFLDNVKLKTARRGASGSPAPWIETCSCPPGYVGQFCESCAPGYTHEPKNGGPFARCVKCSCHGHGHTNNVCHPETGQCFCQHNTAGDNCERCARGFYGTPVDGNPDDCQPCPCPNLPDKKGACIQIQDQVVCLECPEGYAGPQCEFCADGYFGNPQGKGGLPATDCVKCNCNGNIDDNAVGNCNRTTGECLKCIYNTDGTSCEKCAAGFFGNALADPRGNCSSCQCNPLGTVPTPDGEFVCDPHTGQCPCKDNVHGRQCDQCEDGFYDLLSGEGCKACNCDLVGSIIGPEGKAKCDVRTGQCVCQEGIVGLRCQECAPNHFGFSYEGCTPCDCDPIGSLSLQCDPSGQCPCRDNVEGLHCERCKENKFNRQAGCVNCPACYNLVQEAVNAQRVKLDEMEKLLEDIANTPTVIDDVDFERKLAQVQERVNQLWTDARSAGGGDDKSLLERVNELKDRIRNLDDTAKQIRESLKQCAKTTRESSSNLTIAESTIEQAAESLKNAQRFLDTEGKEALERAQEKSFEQSQQQQIMAEKAKDARRLAEDHEAQIQELEKIASTALNTSKEAHDIVWNSVHQQRNVSDETKALTQSVQRLEDEIKMTELKAKNALDVAKEAHNNALNLFKDAYSLSLPEIDFKMIKTQAEQAKKTAENLKSEVESLLAKREQLLSDANEESMKAKELLANTFKHQQMADELLADLDIARDAAEKARNKSEDTYKEAQEIYATLQNFTKNVDTSKDEAERAKERIPEIRTMIYEADKLTQQNRAALYGAKEAASRSLDDAEEAKNIAEKAAEEASTVLAECKDTKVKAADLSEEAKSLSGRVAETLGNLADIEEKIAEEEQLVKGALDKASEAQRKSQDGYEKVQAALNTVRDISLALNNLDEINVDSLDTLTQKVSEVEKELLEADLDAKIETLRIARNKQALWIKNYEDELEALQKEVENVEEIRNALPPDTKCYKRMRLEP